MRVVIQRVSHANVIVDNQVTGAIEKGLMVLVGFGQNDNEDVLKPMAEKIANMRIFGDEAGRMNLSLIDISGGLLLVPQFTLYADTSKGRRPEFFSAKPPKEANELFDKFVTVFSRMGISKVQQGQFQAHMHVNLENDGPVTIWVEM